ncbi:hypothetical protein CS8_051110 [Cupriavidus sp. 8B]
MLQSAAPTPSPEARRATSRRRTQAAARITENGEKKTGRSAQVLPRSVVYDPELTLTLPPAISATSGLNAMAYCVEAMYAADANPVTTLIAEDGIRALASGLPDVVAHPHDMAARSACLYGA